MKYNELTLRAKKSHNRVGRGISAGQGKTAGRGTKGQKSRAGNGRRPGFAGGQIQLTQSLPKLRGFKAAKAKAEIVYTSDLNKLKGTVTNRTLFEAGLIKSAHDRAKVVVRGELTSKVDVKLQGATAGAVELIQKAGGSFTTVERIMRESKPKNQTKNDDKAARAVVTKATKKARAAAKQR